MKSETMIKETRDALIACVVSFVVCAVAYPAAVWGLGQMLFPEQAEGSLVYSRDRTVLGSELIAQPFASDGYFQPRPSAAGATGYAADAASGSNLGTKNPALRQRIELDVARRVQQRTGDSALKALLDRLDTEQAELKSKNEIQEKSKADTEVIAKLEERVGATQTQIVAAAVKLGEASKENLVPADLVTTSGGGLDPHISPASAEYQASRIAAARKMPLKQVRRLIERFTEHSGEIIGAPARVNVLKINGALDEEKPEVDPVAAAVDEARSVLSGLSGDVTGLRSQMTRLAGRLDELGKQIEASHDDKAAAALKQLEARLATVAENTTRASALSTDVNRIDDRVRAAGEMLRQIQTELDETRAGLKKGSLARPEPGQRK
jgi:K+-transporting ATPase ATPase C chain